MKDLAHYSGLSFDEAERIRWLCREVKELDFVLENSLDGPWISIVELVDSSRVDDSEAIINNLITT